MAVSKRKASTGKTKRSAPAKAAAPGRAKKRNALTAVEGLGAKNIEWVPHGDVKPYPGNPKRHGDADVLALAGMIAARGFNNPIEVDRNMVIIAGHGRWLAAGVLGLEQVPVVRLLHLTPQQVREERLADNQANLLSEYDPDALAKELMAVKASGIDLAALGFSPEDLARMVRSGDYLKDLIGAGADEHDGNDGVKLGKRGVAIKFDMLPGERDTVVAWLGVERDKRRLRTAAQALVALAIEASKGKG